MHQLIGIKTRSPVVVKIDCAKLAVRQQRQRFGYPVRMRRTTGNVDYRQPRGIANVRAEQAAVEFAIVLQTTGLGRIDVGRRDPAKGRTGAEGNHMPRPSGDLTDPLGHRRATSAKAMIGTAALRPAQHRAFDAQDIDGTATVGTLGDQLACLVDSGFGNAGMSEQLEPSSASA